MSTPPSTVLRRGLSALLLAPFLPLTLFGQGATGTISGRVFNAATEQYVRNAEVTLTGTDRTVITAADGSFTFTRVPAGQVNVTVRYTGYSPATVEVQVAPGTMAAANVTLAPRERATDGAPIQLDKLVVSTEREGNAKAIMDQKQSMNVSNIVAAETFGNIAEGNIGEFVKYLPGIQMDSVEADARSPRIRGLPAQYTSVTFDGMKVASADGFIQNNGTDNGGGAGAGSRSFGFEQVSMSSIDAVEVNFTTNASQDADSPAGNINLRPKHAYERAGQVISYDFSVFANSEQLTLGKKVRPDDKPNRLLLPNALLEYSNSFFHNRLGVTASVNESNSYNEQRQFVPSYDTNATAADPRPLVVTRLQYKDGPKFSERTTGSFTLDFKANSHLTLSLIGTLNNYAAFIGNRTFGVSTTRANTLATDGFTAWSNVPVTSLTSTMSYLNKRTHGYTYLPSFELKWDKLEITGAAVISESENNYAGGQSKSLPGNSMGGTSLALTGMTVSATRSGDDLYGWSIRQTGGLDWGDIANYKAAATSYPTFSVDGRYNRNLIYQGKLDVRYTTNWSHPTTLFVGGKITEDTYIYQNPTAWQTWNYVGPGGGLGGSWANYPSQFQFDPGHGASFSSPNGRTPAVQDHNTVGKLFESNPEDFVLAGTAANYLTAFVTNPRYVREQIDALYAMFNTKPLPQVEVQGGVRWERTRDLTKDFNPVGSAAVAAAGYPINATTGQATTIPGIQYQYFSNPRGEHSKGYGEFYPSLSVKYALRPSLDLLFGYSYAVTRPAFGDLAGVYTEKDSTQEIVAPNPNLAPQYANNYSLRLAYYFEPVGSLAVGAFENDFKNFVQTQRFPGIASQFGYTDPFYNTYTLVIKDNIPGTVTYRGLTLEYSQALSFLRRPFNGLNVFANYTRTYTMMKLPTEADYHAASPYNFAWLPGIAPNVINYGVNFSYRRVTLGAKARWTDRTGTTSTYNTWMAENTKVDLSASLRISDRMSLYLNARNAFNTPDHTFIGNNPQQIGGGRSYEYYGAYWYAGVKGRF